MTREQFILKSREIHGWKYDYSKVSFSTLKEKVCIICPKHGEFWQEAGSHLRGCGCRKCADEKRKQKQTLTTQEFILFAKKKHGEKYDYSKSVYTGNHEKVLIICPKHGEFFQVAGTHLKGSGCKKCGNETESQKKRKTTTETLVKKFIGVHGDKYDYSKVIFNGWKEKVEIFCKKHGVTFFMQPANHLNGQGCEECKKEKISKSQIKKTFDEFLNEAKKVHGNKYDYSLSHEDYYNVTKKIKIICHKKDSKGNEHGVFWQRVCDHINGGSGCPKCRESKLEQDISIFLIENNIEFTYQKTFSWLKNKTHMFLDFYLPKQQIAIECQGEQHFGPVNYFGGEKMFKKTKERDTLKKKLCNAHNITILYFSNIKKRGLINDKNLLLKKISKT